MHKGERDDDLLVQDIVQRIKILYEVYLDLSKAIMSGQYYKSELEFVIKNDKDVNSKSGCNGVYLIVEKKNMKRVSINEMAHNGELNERLTNYRCRRSWS